VSVDLKNTFVFSLQILWLSVYLYTWVSKNSIILSRAVNLTLMPGIKEFRKFSNSSNSLRVPGQTPKISSRNLPYNFGEILKPLIAWSSKR